MAGVLPGGFGGGVLADRFAERRPRVAGFLKQNPSALLNFGLGLLSGGNRSEAWGNAQQGMAYGSQADQARRDRTQAEEERARQDEAVQQLLMSPEFAALPAEYRTMLTTDRELARQFIASDLGRRMTPAPTPDGFTLSPGEQRFDGNGNPIAALPPEPNPGYRPLTDPTERAARGIPAEDTRPYQISPDGQVSLVGGSGVTINNGTVDERRYALLYRTAVDELPVIEETFGALGELGNQAADRLPGAISAFIVSEDYKRAKNAVIAVIQAQTYAMTGAAAPESEAERLAGLMMPAINDGPQVIAEKLARIRRAISNLGSYSDIGAASPGGASATGGAVDLRRGAPDMPAGQFGPRFSPPPAGAVELLPGIVYLPSGA